jgi:hypothetical protein
MSGSVHGSVMTGRFLAAQAPDAQPGDFWFKGEPEVTRWRDEGIAAECQILARDHYRCARPNMTPAAGRGAGGRRTGPRRARRAAPRPGRYRAGWG